MIHAAPNDSIAAGETTSKTIVRLHEADSYLPPLARIKVRVLSALRMFFPQGMKILLPLFQKKKRTRFEMG